VHVRGDKRPRAVAVGDLRLQAFDQISSMRGWSGKLMENRSVLLTYSIQPPPPLWATARLAEAFGEGGWAGAEVGRNNHEDTKKTQDTKRLFVFFVIFVAFVVPRV
jgi:hypothetical protein